MGTSTVENQIVIVYLTMVFIADSQIQVAILSDIVAIDVNYASAHLTDEVGVRGDITIQTFLAVDHAYADDAAFLFKAVDIAVYCAKAQIWINRF